MFNKIYRGYKCEHPAKTLKNIHAGLVRHFGSQEKFKIATKFRRCGPFHSCACRMRFLHDETESELGRRGQCVLRLRRKNPPSELCTDGKGTSRLLALASAQAELVERFSWIMATRKLEGCDGAQDTPPAPQPRAVDIKELYSKYRFTPSECGKAWTFLNNKKQWIKAAGFLDGGAYRLPYKIIGLTSGSNGLAAGNNVAEATVQAFCEVFERASLAAAMRMRRPLPTVDQGTIADQEIRRYLKFYRDRDIQVTIKDLSVFRRFPCVGVVFVNKRYENCADPFVKSMFHKRIRAGSHFDIKQALIRCFTENHQGFEQDEYFRPEDMSSTKLGSLLYHEWFLGAAGGTPKEFLFHNPHATARIVMFTENMAHLARADRLVPFESLSSFAANDCDSELARIRGLLTSNGLKAYVVDFTDEKIGFPVVEVIIPNVSDNLDLYFADRKKPTCRRFIKILKRRQRIATFQIVFERFIQSDGWLRSRRGLGRLLRELESFLKERFLWTTYLSPLVECRLLTVLAQGYLRIGDIARSSKYFGFLRKVSLNGTADARLGAHDYFGGAESKNPFTDPHLYRPVQLSEKDGRLFLADIQR